MPRFEYVTQKRKGDSYVRSVIEGNSLADVSIRLNNLNQAIVLISDPSRKTTAEKKERVSIRSKLTFLENLEASVYLGMDFRTALSICLSTTSTRDRSGKRMHHIIERLRDRVSKGMSFSNAIASYPEVFDQVAIGLISAGEEGGTLTEALTNVRKIWARNEDLRHRLLMMLIYPMIVLTAAGGIGRVDLDAVLLAEGVEDSAVVGPGRRERYDVERALRLGRGDQLAHPAGRRGGRDGGPVGAPA